MRKSKDIGLAAKRQGPNASLKGALALRMIAHVDDAPSRAIAPFPSDGSCARFQGWVAMEAPMTSTPHLDQIERKYQTLKDQISQARQHPSIDDLELAELKRQKLHLKDELERLRQSEAERPS